MPAPNRPLDEHGFPIPVTFDDDRPPRWKLSPQERRFLRGLLAVLVIAVIGSILVGPQLKQGYFESLAQWHADQAEDAFLNGDPAAAAEEISDAIYWKPDSARLYERRAEFHQQSNHLDASLADWNKVLEMNPTYYAGYQARSFVYCRLGKFAESLADANAAVNNTHSGNPNAFNHRAYMRALAKQELTEGLADVERAIKLTSEAPVPAFLDTRGYLRHLTGDDKGAMEDLNQAIQMVEKQRNNPDELFGRRRRIDARQIAFYMERLNQDLAVMYHHRGEVRQKLGQDEAAAADLKQADKLGYDPDKGIF
jgi:tetratricopeptide (TPR) repeat protein